MDYEALCRCSCMVSPDGFGIADAGSFKPLEHDNLVHESSIRTIAHMKTVLSHFLLKCRSPLKVKNATVVWNFGNGQFCRLVRNEA